MHKSLPIKFNFELNYGSGVYLALNSRLKSVNSSSSLLRGKFSEPNIGSELEK